MDMGSTAKLRTLITYLEIMEELYYRLSGRNGIVRGIDQPSDSARHDVLTAWAAAFLGRHPDAACDEMLDSSVERSYSASPNESFFTGGGTHRFENFEEGEDGQAFTVREAFARSVNLSFIRLMRDIVNYHIAGNPNAAAVSRDGTGGPWKEYLNSFIQFESGVLLWNFYRQLKKIPAADLADSLACDAGLQPSRLAAIYCAVAPRPSLAGMKDFFERHGPIDTLSELPHRVFTQCQSFSWADRGYVAKIHPLKLWAASRLAENPGLRFGELKAQSLPYLHDMYRWIFSPRRIAFQKSRIKIMLEMEAFNAILHSWRRQGYPFAEMTPSLASAIGASADRPFALAQLAGIIQNDGRQCPEKHIERIHFGAGTPYETVLRIPDSVPCRQVISPEVAGVARSCMFEVTRKGTAVHARTMLDSTMAVGGKTGTGDHRVRYFNRHGRQTGEKVVERTATFVFIIGKRYFGVVTAAVLGEGAKDYGFTSSLPVRIFTLITPKIEPLLLEN
jgi:cell division protein FtsI/penicillin-binding protein 2